jgi:hypothetical protein
VLESAASSQSFTQPVNRKILTRGNLKQKAFCDEGKKYDQGQGQGQGVPPTISIIPVQDPPVPSLAESSQRSTHKDIRKKAVVISTGEILQALVAEGTLSQAMSTEILQLHASLKVRRQVDLLKIWSLHEVEVCG